MSDYRRWFVAGGTFFFTVVTYNRRPILTTDQGRSFLRTAIVSVRKCHPFTLMTNVSLPDHWHLMKQLPPRDDRYSLRMKQIKAELENAPDQNPIKDRPSSNVASVMPSVISVPFSNSHEFSVTKARWFRIW